MGNTNQAREAVRLLLDYRNLNCAQEQMVFDEG